MNAPPTLLVHLDEFPVDEFQWKVYLGSKIARVLDMAFARVLEIGADTSHAQNV